MKLEAALGGRHNDLRNAFSFYAQAVEKHDNACKHFAAASYDKLHHFLPLS